MAPLRPSPDSGGFRAEERNAAKLNHPGIVKIFEVGQDGDVLYYTMELVCGQPLDTVKGDLKRLERSGPFLRDVRYTPRVTTMKAC